MIWVLALLSACHGVIFYALFSHLFAELRAEKEERLRLTALLLKKEQPQLPAQQLLVKKESEPKPPPQAPIGL